MKRSILLLLLALVACQDAEPERPANGAAKIPVDELGLPTRQPDGSPLTAAFCRTEEAAKIYGNLKGCSMVSCDQGDKESCEIAQAFAASQAPDEAEVARLHGTTAKLEDMNYSDARKVILSHGWEALPGGCQGGGVDEETCRQYPEIGNCQGTWPAFCDMTFVRRDRCLTLVTYGGPPGPDTVIRDVRFSKGPCVKDPNEGRP